MKCLIIVLLLTGCSGRFYAGAGLGKNGLQSEDWAGRDALACTAEAGYLWRNTNHDIDLGWSHYSQCNVKTKDESTLDSVTLSGRYYF